jgi:FkbM family methyltransferase
MKYDFIEIGTSDFRTLSADKDKKGISIEPVKPYFDNLTPRDGLIKINAAISDKSGFGVMHYCRPEFVDRLKLPQWLKGCNSLNQEHTSVRTWTKQNGIRYKDLVAEAECPLVTLETIFEAHDVEKVQLLKIDTEGHDAVIMKNLLSMEEMPYIYRIQFESNDLMNPKDLINILKLAYDKGYSYHNVTTRGNQDTILTLNF